MSEPSSVESRDPAAGGALQGLRVLELGSLIAGPFATRLLAEFGADVVKVESPARGGEAGGDPLRGWRQMHAGTSLWWAAQARNKRCITLDLKSEAGRDVVLRLVRRCDVLVENMRPGVLEKLGLGWEQLSQANPSLVMVRISGFGQTGPLRAQPGFGAIAESMGGMRYVTGDPAHPPMRSNLSLGDSIAALHAVMGALMALRHRDATGGRFDGHQGGQGQVVDVALTESVFNLMESTLMEYSVGGTVRERCGSSIAGIVPSNVYRSAAGEWVQISGNGDAIFRRLMLAIGREDLASRAELATNPGRIRAAAEIDQAIQQWVGRHDAPQVVQAMREADVPASRIYSIADICADEQFRARGMIERHALPDGTPVDLPGVVPRLSRTPGGTRWLGPALGAHNEQVLAELGFDAEAIEALRRDGVL
ncbi:MAG: CoA transferase [Betaproteobacteria bacterium]|nr:CoA transferase [Betaproteobacteria bacterium]MBU6510913.1 CoA transferase [Betaproteobacteria bacterium]MDE1954138.1 CoA transferase [Betaproteobacteria bacterium]MDE2151248.1 CoA transferase [Betaproteobacteria bacterium]MDE2477812.1 CoA transferase [Betaproteobacteria bacterium]